MFNLTMHVVAPIVITLLLLSCAAYVLRNLTRIFIVFVTVLILLPIVCTIMWGDGQEYVASIASLLPAQEEQRVNGTYQTYHDTNARAPVLDLEQVKAAMKAGLEWMVNTLVPKVEGSMESISLNEPYRSG